MTSSSDDPGHDDRLRSLAAKVRDSCRVSFESLYALTSPSLLGLILSINRDRNQAELVLEETYVRAWSQRSQVDADTCGRWLSALASEAAHASLKG